MAMGSGTQSRQEARLGLQPLTDYAGTPLTIGWPILREDVVDDVRPEPLPAGAFRLTLSDRISLNRRTTALRKPLT
jgi:hypothetical protein